jgi:DNA-binding response OmpR family regulator
MSVQGCTIKTSLDLPVSNPILVNVLHVSSSERDRARLRYLFDSTNWQLTQAHSFEEACSWLASGESFTVLLCDRQLQTMHWKDLLDEVVVLSHRPTVIVSAPSEDTEVWAEALNLGADDVLATPFEAAEVYWVLSEAHRSWLTASKPVGRQATETVQYLSTA